MSRNWANLTWGEKTWGERGQTALCWIIASAVGLAMLIGALFVVGASLDGVARYNTERDRCLKRAINGYEIKQCR